MNRERKDPRVGIEVLQNCFMNPSRLDQRHGRKKNLARSNSRDPFQSILASSPDESIEYSLASRTYLL